MKFGNLDSLSLGMGLVAKPEQQIPAQYAALDGWNYLSAAEANEAIKARKSLGLLGTLAIIVIIYKLFTK